MKRIHVIQGAFEVSNDPDVVLTTVLGSCVSCCIRDPEVGIGGMNHFLLPNVENDTNLSGNRYGVHLMEVLLNELFKCGAARERLEAKIFGGGQVVKGLSNIGEQNVAFAEEFLKLEEINLLGGNTCGDKGRRVEFWPVSGRARQKFLEGVDVEVKSVPVAPPLVEDVGDVELF